MIVGVSPPKKGSLLNRPPKGSGDGGPNRLKGSAKQKVQSIGLHVTHQTYQKGVMHYERLSVYFSYIIQHNNRTWTNYETSEMSYQ